MLWIPFRSDEAMASDAAADSSEEDGGSKTLAGGPRSPHRPRAPAEPFSGAGHTVRSPHPPRRVRGPRRAARRVGSDRTPGIGHTECELRHEARARRCHGAAVAPRRRPSKAGHPRKPFLSAPVFLAVLPGDLGLRAALAQTRLRVA
jgi:hypothetical protein